MLYLTVYELLMWILVAGVVLLCLYQYLPPCRNFPPGPWGLPFLGSLMSVKGPLCKEFMNLTRKYGNVYGIKLGTQLMVVVNGIDACKEALVTRGSDFADRPYDWAMEIYNPKYEGMCDCHYDETYQHQRKFVLNALRRLGLGGVNMEKKIREGLKVLLSELHEMEGQPCDPGKHLNMSLANVLCAVLFGRRFENSDPKFQEHMQTFAKWGETFNKLAFPNVFPPLRPFATKEIRGLRQLSDNIESFCRDEINAHRSSLNPSDIRDLIDAYIQESENQCNDEFSDNRLIFILFDLFGAGAETSATSLKWALLLMILHPNIQERVAAEIHKNVGVSRLPTWNDRRILPYTGAVIHEIQRFGSILPTALPHAAVRDSTIGGYNIPRGTQVIVNLWSIHNDTAVWTDPEKFDPSRFYDEATGSVIKRESYLPFSAGRRGCLGKVLAEHEVFLYFSSLMHRFKFSHPVGTPKPSMEGIVGFAHIPKPFNVIMESRM